jgi:hypothetical protein
VLHQIEVAVFSLFRWLELWFFLAVLVLLLIFQGCSQACSLTRFIFFSLFPFFPCLNSSQIMISVIKLHRMHSAKI